MNTLKTTLATAAFLLSSSAMADTINTDLLGFTAATQKVMNKSTEMVEKVNPNLNALECHFDSVVSVHEALRTEGKTEVDMVKIATKHNECLTDLVTARLN